MNNKKIALVTGGNKGIGFGLAEKLAKNNYTVWIGCRNPELGKKAESDLRAQGLDVNFVELDVTNQKTIDAAVKTLSEKNAKLDLLVNNAGIYTMKTDGAVSNVKMESFLETFDVNVYGVVRVTQAFLPLIQKSSTPKIFNVSSGLGSLNLLLDPAMGFANNPVAAYSASKAALNVITVMLSNELKDSGVAVNSICPGYTATDLNSHSGPQSVEDSVNGLYEDISKDHFTTGHFIKKGGEHPW